MPSLEDVYEEIAADPWWDHIRKPGIALVPGFGCRRPKASVWGEAPGATENARLRPFCGPSGRVLDHLMAKAGLWLEEATPTWDGKPFESLVVEHHANAFVTNVVKYRPPNNATPSIADILHARDGYRRVEPLGWAALNEEGHQRNQELADRYAAVDLPAGAGSLRREWSALGRPRVIILVGGVAHAAMSPMGFEGVTRWAGRPIPKRDKKLNHDIWFVSQLHPAYGLRKGPKVQDQMSGQWTEMGEFLSKEGLL